jgi:dihydroflavonol-4-reductase
MNMIVVTGATGHIGNVLIRQLLDSGNTVRAVVPMHEDLRPLRGLAVEIVTGDVRDPASLNKCFQGAEIVYHLAGIISIIPGKSRILEDVNVLGTRNVVNACRERGVKRLVYTSSIHALKEPRHGLFISETQPFDPVAVLGDYAKSKARASLEVLKGIQQGLDAVIVCPTGVIGPYDFKGSEMGHLIMSFLGSKLPAGVNGAYDFIDVRDVATGIILAAEKGLNGEVYILSGEHITIRKLFKSLEVISGTRAPRIMVPCWLARIAGVISTPFILWRKRKPLFTAYSIDVLTSNSAVNCNKAKIALGFSARPLIDSLSDTVTWFREEAKVISTKVTLGHRITPV